MHLAWYSWLLGFTLTLTVELPIGTWLLRGSGTRLRRRLLLVAFASLMTHPLVWFFFPKLPLTYAIRLTLSEGFAFLAEALFYWVTLERLGVRRAVMTSFLANGASFGLGYVFVAQYARWFYA